MIKPVSSIKKTNWGFADGKEVWLFCLENKKGTKLYVSNFGATAQALLIADKNGNQDDVLLGYPDLPSYEQDEYYIGSVVGRHANRISTAEINIEGKKYPISVKEGGYHLHGGVKGFNKRVFDYTIDNNNRCSITFSYLSEDMEEGFPGNLLTKVTYTLDDENRWHIEYECSTDKTTILNITQHAYFNLAGHSSGSILDHEMQINATAFLPVNHLQVPNGTVAAVDKTVFDFLNPKPIGLDINKEDEQLLLSKGYDHSWVLKKQASPELRKAVIVKEPVSGRMLEVLTTEPAVHFYSGNFLNNTIHGKDNEVYDKRSGFCLETQHYPDSPNNPDFPSIVLHPGEKFYSKSIYAFSVAKE